VMSRHLIWLLFRSTISPPPAATLTIARGTVRRCVSMPGACAISRVAMLVFAAGFSHACAEPARASGGQDLEAGSKFWWGTGLHSGYVEPGSDGLAACIRDGFVARDKIAVSGRQRYRLSVRIRTEDAAVDSAFVQVSFRGAGVDAGWQGPLVTDTGPGEERVQILTGGTHDWFEQSAVFEAPENAAQLVVYLRKKPSASGIACYGSVTLAATDEAVTSEAAASRQSLFGQFVAISPGSPHPAEIPSGRHDGRRPPDPDRLRAIAQDQTRRIDIHVPDHPDVVTLNAAIELAKYLGQMTGASFLPLQPGEGPPAGPMIVVGRNDRIAKALVPDEAYSALGPDGFLIRTVGEHLVIAGATPRGTSFGVFWFLDHHLGVRWLAPDMTYVPKRPTLLLPTLDETHTPRFEYREVLSFEGQDKSWRVHNLLNGESHGPSFAPTPAKIDVFDRRWNAKGTVANFYELLPPAVFRQSHPDWYFGGQVTMMNSEMRAALADAVIARLRRLPDYREVWFAVHDEDRGWDMDPASGAFAARHGGTPAAPRLDMMIDVANRVRAALPGARLAFNAYHWSFTPPPDIAVPDYLLVYPMTIQVDYRTALNEETNTALARDLVSWSNIANNIIVWDHVANFLGYIQPHPNIRAVARSIKWLSGLRAVRGYFAEGVWDTPGGEFVPLRNWLIARLLWDPQQDIDALIADYAAHRYGPAAKYILQYIALEERAVAESQDRLTEKTPLDLKMLTVGFAESADRLYDEAEEAARGTEFFAHVRRERLPLDFVILAKADEYQRALDELPNPWALDLDRRRERFWQTASAVGLLRTFQGGDLAALSDMLAIRRRVPVLPSFVGTVDPADRRDIQDTSLLLFGPARLVADASASDGAAIRMPAGSTGWNVQMKLDRLPRRGAWRLFAAVRASDRPRHPASATGMLGVGSHPPMDCVTAVPMSSIAGSAYHFMEVPGGPHRYSTDHERSVYFQSIPGEDGGDVLVDRIFAVRAGVRVEPNDRPARPDTARCDTTH
jgi:hypothetical protein